jgi:hypothetical protein
MAPAATVDEMCRAMVEDWAYGADAARVANEHVAAEVASDGRWPGREDCGCEELSSSLILLLLPGGRRWGELLYSSDSFFFAAAAASRPSS